MRFEGGQRKSIALGVLAALAGLAWLSMEAGRPRWLAVIVLAGLGLRILLAGSPSGGSSRYDESGEGK